MFAPTGQANRLLWNLTGFRDLEPQDLVFSLQTYYIVRAHRSHRWGRWFESNCHHSLPSSGGLFFTLFHFRACLPQKLASSENRPNPCPTTVSGPHGPHMSQQRGNTVWRNNSARILMRNEFSPPSEYVL